MTKLFLEHYLFKNTYGADADYVLASLFKDYTDREVNNIDDIKRAGVEFFTFIKNNENKIIKKIAKPEDFYEEAKCILGGLVLSTHEYHKNDKRLFVNTIKEFMPSKDTKILDVGAGCVPFSSFLFAETYDYVSAMDKFILTLDFLEKFNVEGIETFFNDKTDISNYDIVVGKKPCSAIPYIAQNCTQNNKPYFIEMCDCTLPETNPYTGEKVTDWKDVLRQIDINITFYQNYAFNIDATEDQVRRILENNLNPFSVNKGVIVLIDTFTRFLHDIIQKSNEYNLNKGINFSHLMK